MRRQLRNLRSIRGALLVLGGIGLAALCVRSAAISMQFADPASPAWTRIASEPRVELIRANDNLIASRFRVSPGTERLARRVLRIWPLADEPFALFGVASLARQRDAEGLEYLIEARQREPRAPLPRLLLLGRYVLQGNIANAGNEVAVLAQLLPEAGAILLPPIAQMAEQPGSERGLARVFSEQPRLRDDVLTALAAGGMAPQRVILLAGPAGRASGGPATAWQTQLISSAITRGDFSAARAIWLRFGGRQLDAGQYVYDPEFGDAPGAAPFNWNLMTSGEGIAERTTDGLQIEYYGRATAQLASELLTLPAGTYSFASDTATASTAAGESLSWSVKCVPGGATLFSAPIASGARRPAHVQATFAVPAGCAAQTVSLDGTQPDLPTTQHAVIRRVTIRQSVQ